MRRYTFMILALFLLEFCGLHSLKVDDHLETGMANTGELWAELKNNHIMNLIKGYQGHAQGWTNERWSTNEKRANVKKWWWLLSSDSRPRQGQQKWKKGSTSLVCYFKVCAVPAPV